MFYLLRSASVVCIMVSLLGCGNIFSWEKVSEVPTVALDNTEDFMGCWYVISSIPNSIEAGAEDSMECYQLRSNGKIDTTFTFYRDGELNTMRPVGRVRRDLDSDGGVWGMKFNWNGWLPLPEMAYLILEFDTVYDAQLDQDIEVSIVGGPTADTLWIMAREPAISPALHEALKSVAAPYYNVQDLQTVAHPRNL